MFPVGVFVLLVTLKHQQNRPETPKSTSGMLVEGVGMSRPWTVLSH